MRYVTSVPTGGHAAGDQGRSGVRTFEVRTYGCQMNVHDSERLAGLLEGAGYRRAEPGAEGAEVGHDDLAAVRRERGG